MASARRLLLLGLVATGLLALVSEAQLRPRPIADLAGRVGLELLLRRLATSGTLLMATAHPDDENNGLLARLTWGEGIRTILATATRGDGGQNEIGPELSDLLAVLRTEELLAAHRFDGAEQYFTRAVDFGYSFSVEETFAKWGREEILADYVRLIRTVRPDVVVTLRPDGEGGGQHHQAAARLAAEAFRTAADPQRFPDQLRQGLRPWQPARLYVAAGFGGGGDEALPGQRAVTVDLDHYDPLLGRTYAEIGREARSMHKSQGMPQLLPLPGERPNVAETARYALVEAVSSAGAPPAEQPTPGAAETVAAAGPRLAVPLFEGLDVSLPGLVRVLRGGASGDLVAALRAIAGRVDEARRVLASGDPAAATPALLAGLLAVRDLRTRLASVAGQEEAGRFELDYRLQQKEREFARAVLVAQGVHVDALADDGVVTPGQAVKVTLAASSAGARPVRVREVRLLGFDAVGAWSSASDGGPGCTPGELQPRSSLSCTTVARIPTSSAVTKPYFRRLPDAARHPLFTRPNRIGEDAWRDWVQERGLYFLEAEGRDPRYVDLVSLEDPFEYNRGVKTGALVEARYGKGRWLYVGLGLWRQLPAGTTGAYQLLANLISLGKAGQDGNR